MRRTSKQILCADYEVDRKKVSLPLECPTCHAPGLVLIYNYIEHQVEALCYARENGKGRFIAGCNKFVWSLHMTKAQYHGICRVPQTGEHFFFLETYGDEDV